MADIKVWMLGKFRVQYYDVVPLTSQRAQELFSYLLLNRHRALAREALADLVWQDSGSSEKSSKRLRQAIWQLQCFLSPIEAGVKEPLLLNESNWIQINPEVDIWLDVSHVEAICRHYQGVHGATLNEDDATQIQDAVDLYKGELLESCYEAWCLYTRERIQNMYVALLDKLADFYEAQQVYETAIFYGFFILKQDPSRECTHYRLMRLFFKAGDRTSALHQYDRCCVALEEELGVSPASSTTALYQHIKANQNLSLVSNSLLSASGDRQFLPDMLRRLEQLQTMLTHLQSQVEQEIITAKPVIQTQQ